MKDPAVKTALALCVLLGGFCAAMLFRHDRPRLTAINPNIEDEVLLRCRSKKAASPPGRSLADVSATRETRKETLPEANPAIVVAPPNRREPPPSFSSGAPLFERPASARWGQSMEMMLPVVKSADDANRTHTVVDGDRLETLAERYLGTASRADEIYQANRDVINNPRLLPIGVDLKIPPRNR